MEAVEINGTVSLEGIAVRPGDVIAADDAGVCVIPLEYLGAVKDAVLEAEQAEREVTAAIRRGAPVEEVARILNPERW